MNELFHIVHILVAVGLIGLILIQHGKGADAGAAFGSGASGTVFGSQGSGSFLSRATSVLAAAFFVTCLILAYFSTQKIAPESVISTTTEAPAAVSPEQVNLDIPAPTTMPADAASDVPMMPLQDNSGVEVNVETIKVETNEAPAPSVDAAPAAATEQEAPTTE
jgi:preprotein translocase subunit SecG